MKDLILRTAQKAGIGSIEKDNLLDMFLLSNYDQCIVSVECHFEMASISFYTVDRVSGKDQGYTAHANKYTVGDIKNIFSSVKALCLQAKEQGTEEYFLHAYEPKRARVYKKFLEREGANVEYEEGNPLIRFSF